MHNFYLGEYLSEASQEGTKVNTNTPFFVCLLVFPAERLDAIFEEVGHVLNDYIVITSF